MVLLLRRRRFALLWTAGFVSVLGDWVLLAALPYFVFATTGSALATGVMFAAATGPRVAFGSIAGVLVDRWDRQRTMVVADLSRALLLLALLLVRGPAALWLIYAVSFAEATISLVFGPAKASIIPRVVNPTERMAANSLNSLGDNVGRLLGPAIGGALLGALGLPGVALADAFSYLISGCLIALIALAPLIPSAGTTGSQSAVRLATALWHEWLACPGCGSSSARCPPPWWPSFTTRDARLIVQQAV